MVSVVVVLISILSSGAVAVNARNWMYVLRAMDAHSRQSVACQGCGLFSVAASTGFHFGVWY
jgi:hypothetical protein